MERADVWTEQGEIAQVTVCATIQDQVRRLLWDLAIRRYEFTRRFGKPEWLQRWGEPRQAVEGIYHGLLCEYPTARFLGISRSDFFDRYAQKPFGGDGLVPDLVIHGWRIEAKFNHRRHGHLYFRDPEAPRGNRGRFDADLAVLGVQVDEGSFERVLLVGWIWRDVFLEKMRTLAFPDRGKGMPGDQPTVKGVEQCLLSPMEELREAIAIPRPQS